MTHQTDTKLATGPDLPRTRAPAIALAIALIIAYGLTAEWDDTEVNMDAEAAAIPAWSLVNRGTLEVGALDTVNPWVVETDSGEFSNRPFAISALAVPAYAAAPNDRFSNGPATATAVVVTALAMTVLFLALARETSSSWAMGVTLVVAFGTATWPIASTQLWPHGPGQLVAALGIFGLVAGRELVAASSLGYATLLRPPTIIFAGVLALDAARRRAWARAVVIGGAGIIALASVSLYNLWMFDRFGPSGGYSSVFGERLVSIDSGYLSNLAQMLFLPRNGLLLWSPIILVAVVALVLDRPKVPRWTIAPALAGLVYLLVHAQLNRASGGLVFNYRYPLEALILATPLLSAGAREWWDGGKAKRMIVVAAAALSIALQGLYLFGLSCVPYEPGLVSCSLLG